MTARRNFANPAGLSERNGVAYALFGSADVDGHRRHVAVVKCANECGTETAFPIRPDAPEQLVRKKADNAGWAVAKSGRSATCPQCIKPARLAAKDAGVTPIIKGASPEQEPDMAEKNVTRLPAPDLPLRTSLAIANDVTDQWDEKAGRYLSGESDETIGTRHGQPWGVVKRIRLELGLEEKVSPEIAALQDDVAKASREVEKLIDRIAGLEGRLREIAQGAAA